MTVSGMPIVSFLILCPLVGALVCLGPWFRGHNARFLKGWGAFVALVNLGYLVGLATSLQSGDSIPRAIEEVTPWIPGLGVSFHFTFDGISLAFALLTALVSLVVLVWGGIPAKAAGGWYALILASEGAVMGAFLATDLVLFYVFYELMLLPVLGAMAWYGGERRLQAALKFVLYTVAASLCMFLAIAYIGYRGRVGFGNEFSFDVVSIANLSMFTQVEQIVLGMAFMAAFAVKIPIVPFHSWLPDTYREAPHALTAFIAAVLGKVGIYAVLRFVWPLFPHFMSEYGSVIAALGATGIVYGALAAMAQKDLKGLLAYSSISHLGFCVLGFSGTSAMALSGVVFQSVSHGLVTAALFLSFGMLADQYGVKDFESFGGLAKRLPRLALVLMVFCLGGVALPLTSGFVGEFLILMGSYGAFPTATVVALAGVILGAVYTLTAYLSLMFGQERVSAGREASDLTGMNAAILGALAMLIVVLGVYPTPLLSVVEPAVSVEEAPPALGRSSVGEADSADAPGVSVAGNMKLGAQVRAVSTNVVSVGEEE